MQSPGCKTQFLLSESQIQTLAEQDWLVIDDLLESGTLSQIKSLAVKHWQMNDFKPAEIGRSSERQKLQEIRGDSIFWLESPSSPISDLLRDLQTQLNEALWLGINHCEVHFARYDKNAGYEAHIDQSSRTNPLLGQRVISFILYLNQDWQKVHAGQLCIHLESPVLIEPIWGRIVLFKSDKVLHSVLPSQSERWSLTGWFRKL